MDKGIRFDTFVCRCIIGKDFSFSNLRKAMRAMVKYIKEKK